MTPNPTPPGWPLVWQLDLDSPADRQAILSFLSPHETHNLFIIGNLLNHYPESYLYGCRTDGQLTGVAGYYARPKSLIPFSQDPETVRALVRGVAEKHRDISYLNAIGYVGRPAYDQMLRLGYRPANDPAMVFMECRLGSPLPPMPLEPQARPAIEADRYALVRLLRLLQDPETDSAVTPEQAAKLTLANRWVIEVDGEVVSSAATNGMGLTAFQILGVVTRGDCRGRGYATAVCAALIRSQMLRGAKACTLFTRASNVAAMSAYKRLGFCVTDDYFMAEFEPTATVER